MINESIYDKLQEIKKEKQFRQDCVDLMICADCGSKLEPYEIYNDWYKETGLKCVLCKAKPVCSIIDKSMLRRDKNEPFLSFSYWQQC